MNSNDNTGFVLAEAAKKARLAARACLLWEEGGEANDVSVYAGQARHAALVAVEAVISDEPLGDPLADPETRRGRLAGAAWLILLAGTDEHGESADLEIAARLFDGAARA